MRSKLMILGLVLALGAASAWAQISVSATLAGGSKGDPDGAGLAVIELKSGQAGFSILVQGIDAPTAAAVYLASDNSVALDLKATFTGSIAKGSVAIPAALESAISRNPGGYFVNVANAAFPNGALQGFLAFAGGNPPAPGVTLHFPVVSKVAGQVGTNYLTDLHLANPNAEDVTVSLQYYRKNTAGLTAPSVTKTVTVPAGRQLVVSDVVGSQLGGTNERGALQIVTPAPIRGQARIYNDLRGTTSPLPGTFSQYSPAFVAADLATRAYLLGLSQVPVSAGKDFRTNIVYFNPTANAVTATFTAYKPDGTQLGSKQFTIPGFANEIVGVFQLIDTVPSAQQEQTSFYITYTASGALIVQASVVDNITGDGLYIVPLPY